MRERNSRPEAPGPTLVVLEGEAVRSFPLAGRERWSLGRKTRENRPDIPLASEIAGRRHGDFFNVDGFWFYCDRGSVNGTFRNGKKLRPGLGGRAAPVLLEDGDVLRIDWDAEGPGDERGVFLLYLAQGLPGPWSCRPLEGPRPLSLSPGGPPETQSAVLTRSQGLWYLSGPQARLNGKPLDRPAPLQDKDWFSVQGRCLIYAAGKLFLGPPACPQHPSSFERS